MRTKYLSVTVLLVMSAWVQPLRAQQTMPGIATMICTVRGVCEQCKERIEGALVRRGIASASWNIDTKLLTVVYDSARIKPIQIHTWVAAVGHDTELKKSKDAVYRALPACCHYRELDGNLVNAADDRKAVIDSSHIGNVAPLEMFVRALVLEEDRQGNLNPLVGASLSWIGSPGGLLTDSNGLAKVPYSGGIKRLLVSYAGFRPDTLLVRDTAMLKVVLAAHGQLRAVEVRARQSSTSVPRVSTIRIQNMSERELVKAACCNLSESFETNPAVDVSFNDAITGSKQIQLLGLSGAYTQLTVENLPGPRGLATPLGLNTIAGPWIESIQLNKGAGSVVNGYESIAGQINVELKKPEIAEQLYVNGYANTQGKSDINLVLAQKIGARWSTALLLHDDFLARKMDGNQDGFRDLPTGNLFSAISRWRYDDNRGFMTQFGLKVMRDNRVGGEVLFDPDQKGTNQHYGLGINIERYEGFAKIGYVFPGKKYKSVGLQLSGFNHRQQSYFGSTAYDAEQNNFFSNLIYQSIIGSTANKFRTGLSVVYDRYAEVLNVTKYNRSEAVAGAFFEYTYSYLDKFSVVAGIRGDHNNLYGWFATPRMHVRYEPVKGTVLRASAGRGQRTANIIAENSSVLASARQFQVAADPGGAYGLDAEVAWNEGVSVDQSFTLGRRRGTVALDFFHTRFTHQVVVDLEDPRTVKFYNLQGPSRSYSFQAEVNYEIIHHLDMRMAYRFFDVRTTYDEAFQQRPLVARHRAFANIAYVAGSWKFDYTVNYTGQKRIPPTTANPPDLQLAAVSPSFVVMNAQASRSFGKENRWEVYVGAENLTDYFQKGLIISAQEPFSPYFDASLVWGPPSGRMFYTGFRFKMK